MERFSNRALPRAVAGTLNQQARNTLRTAKENVKRNFTLRNKYILGSVRGKFTRINPRIHKMETEIGSINTALERQEFGFISRANLEGRRGLATDESRRSKSFKKPVALRFRISQIKKLPFKKGKNSYFISNKLSPRGKAVFLRRGKKLRMIRDLSKTQYTVRPNPWLGPARDKWGKQSMTNTIFIRQSKKALAALGG